METQEIGMKRQILTLLTGSLVVAGRAFAGGQGENRELEVSLEDASRPSMWSNGTISVMLKNNGKSTIYLPRVHTPLYTPENHLMNNVFKVVDERGDAAKFIGRHVRVLPEDGDSYYGRLAPGETLSHEVDLTADYKLLPGTRYELSYEQSYAYGYSQEDGGRGQLKDNRLMEPSNTITFTYMPRKESAQTHRAEPDPAKECTTEQYSAISAATLDAHVWVSKARTRIENLYFVELGKDDLGNTTYSGRLKQDNVYDYWFGAARNQAEPYLSRPSYTDYWRKDDDYLMMKSLNSVGLRLGGEAYLCGCPSTYPWNTAAWTQTEPRNIIHLCDRFFELPVSDGAYDSQRLTIIHEVSHFVDYRGGETADYVYGRNGAHELTTSNRSNAVKNADNLMYFVGAANQ
jgi:hypothetical protein